MSEIVPVRLFTVESSIVGIANRPTLSPYKRVVGMSIGNGMPSELWTPANNLRSFETYSHEDVEQTTIHADRVFASRLSSFYNRFFVEGPSRPPMPEIPGRPDAYNPDRYLTNCHRFGYWMRGTSVAEADSLPEAPDFVVQEGFKAQPNFPLGKHAVLGSGGAVHSVVGLGKDTDTCIQVLATCGNLGIDTYENVLNYYDPNKDKGYAYYV